jgi:hypothetical protein
MTDTSTPHSPRLPRGGWAAAPAILLAVVAACSPAAAPASPSGSGGPSTGPTPSPTAPSVGLEHPTGPTDIVLRFEESGGFVPVEVNATYAPSFTLYGDGRVVFRDPWAPAPEPVGNLVRAVPFQTIQLGEEAIQALLEEAIGPGGLGVASGPYTGMSADIPTSTFTISAGGQTKQVSVTGLSADMHPQDALVVGSLSAFAERLRGFADDVAGEQPYLPEAYRGILFPVEQPFGPVVAWPWPDIEAEEFVAGQNGFFLTRAMTPAEVATLGITGAEGGLQGVALQEGGKIYTFALRPLLPDEAS